MNKGLLRKKRYASLEGWVSIVTNILLAAIKYWAGIVSGSVALIADAWHTLTDSISSVVIIIGGRVSAKPADEKHPFGHGRIEFVATLSVAVLLFVVAISFLRESVIKFTEHKEAVYGTFAIIVTVVSIFAKEGLAQFAFFCSRKSDSMALEADGWHHRSDAISSIIILAGIIFGQKFWWIDSLLGVIVAVLIGYTAYKLTTSTISRILGELPDNVLINKIRSITLEVTGTETYPHHFHLHDYVTHKELTFHLKLDPEINIEEAHKIVTKVEKRIKNELEIEVTIHLEPKKIAE